MSHVHTEERNFECDVCGMRLKTKGILRVHKKIHSTNPDDFLNCDECDRQFKTRNQLTNHKVSLNFKNLEQFPRFHDFRSRIPIIKSSSAHFATLNTNDQRN